MSKQKKIAIFTGITSFLGKSLAKYLITKGFIVFGLVRDESKNLEKISDIAGLRIVKIDFDKVKSSDFLCINDFDIREKIENVKKEDLDITFLHFGWGSTLDRSNFMKQMLNVDMSIKVLEFAKAMGAKRFIFAGSQAEMSESAYGLAKKEFATQAENEIKNYSMNFIHLRIFSIYGNGDRDTSLIMTLLKHIKENRDIELSSCNYDWNFLYIEDFQKIVYKMIERNIVSGTYDMASDDTRLLKKYVEEAHEVLKAKIKLKFGMRPDSSEKFAIPDIKNTLNSVGNIRFTKFREGILKMI